MDRREFIVSAGQTVALSALAPLGRSDLRIMTVRGEIPAAELGLCLSHEHLFSTFGNEASEHPVYEEKRLFEIVIPYIKYLKSLGMSAVADCTANYFGRAPRLLNYISEQADVHILTNTGYYGAAKDRYIPEHAYQESSRQIADRWIREFKAGIGDTGIRPGFMKIGVDEGPLSAIDRKIIEAAALTHMETGLTIAVHTSNNPEAAEQQIAILHKYGISPSAWIWVHAQNVENIAPLLQAAEKGAWISLDGLQMPYFWEGKKLGEVRVYRQLEHLLALRKAGYLRQILLSHDGNSFPRNNEALRPFDTLFNTFIPMMKIAGISEDEIRTITVDNPARAFGIAVRRK